MTNLLKGVIHHGTGRRALSLSPFLGGKTGTTNNNVDAWFVGFSSDLVAGAWVGFDKGGVLGRGETGARSALPIWRDFMREGLRRFGERDFPQPPGVINVLIDKETGRPAGPGLGAGFLESFVEGLEPGAAGGRPDGTEVTGGMPILEDDDYHDGP